MKKLLILTLSAVALLFAACGETEKTPLSVTPRTLEFTYLAGSQTINLTASEAWTASSSATWVTVDPASGTAATPGAGLQVTIRVTEHVGNANRSATVTFTSGEENITLEVNQAAAADISGVWILDFFDRYVDGGRWYEEYFTEDMVDCEDDGCWTITFDTIARRNFNSFYVFSFLKGSGDPQPIIEFNGKDFIYTKRVLDQAKDYRQVPLAVFGNNFIILDTIVLKYDAKDDVLDADYTIRVSIDGALRDANLVFATFDTAPLLTGVNIVDWIESPIFKRLSSATGVPSPKRARKNAVRKGSDIVIEVSADQVGTFDRSSQGRRR